LNFIKYLPCFNTFTGVFTLSNLSFKFTSNFTCFKHKSYSTTCVAMIPLSINYNMQIIYVKCHKYCWYYYAKISLCKMRSGFFSINFGPSVKHKSQRSDMSRSISYWWNCWPSLFKLSFHNLSNFRWKYCESLSGLLVSCIPLLALHL
jgi:hypothetical protein